MSNRFHNKFHRVNHHSVSSPDPKFPDAGYDPIASFDSPFQGEFYSEGDIITTENLSAGIDLTVDNNALIRNNLTVGYDALVENDLTVLQDFTVLGTTSNIDTLVYITSATQIVNAGTGPALKVNQLSSEQIAHFLNDGISSLIIDGRPDSPGFVGINTETPNERLTVVGNVSAVGNLIATQNLSAGINLTVGNDGLIQNNLTVKGNLNVMGTTTQLDTLVYATSALSVTNSGTGPAATFKQTGNEPVAVFYDDNNVALYVDGKTATPGYIGIGTAAPKAKLTVSGTISSSSTVEFPNIGTGEDNSVVILNSNGFLKTNEINSDVWDTTAKFVSAFEGSLSVNYLTKAINSNGLTESIVFDNGTNVGIGTFTPNQKLTVAGSISAAGQGFIKATCTIQSPNSGGGEGGQLTLMDPTSTGGWEIDNYNQTLRFFRDKIPPNVVAMVILSSGNVGIDTYNPSEKLTVNGNINAYGLIIPGTATVTPTTNTALPSSNDVIFNNQTGAVTITGFSSGRAGVTYTLTNKSTYEVTLSSSSNLFVRGGNAWAGYNCSSNPSGKIELPQNFSCSLRMDSTTSGSVW